MGVQLYVLAAFTSKQHAHNTDCYCQHAGAENYLKTRTRYSDPSHQGRNEFWSNRRVPFAISVDILKNFYINSTHKYLLLWNTRNRFVAQNSSTIQ